MGCFPSLPYRGPLESRHAALSILGLCGKRQLALEAKHEAHWWLFVLIFGDAVLSFASAEHRALPSRLLE